MTDAVPHALDATILDRHGRLEQAGTIALFGVVGALQFSIAAAQILLTVAIACWFLLVSRAGTSCRAAVFLAARRLRRLTLVGGVLARSLV
jgi:hypothetical protein